MWGPRFIPLNFNRSIYSHIKNNRVKYAMLYISNMEITNKIKILNQTKFFLKFNSKVLFHTL